MVIRGSRTRGRRTLVAALSVALGCTPTPPQRYERVSKALDDAERKLDEWGTASFSAPILAAPSAAFRFDLSDLKTADLFRDARAGTQARAAVLDESVFVAGLSAALSMDRDAADAHAAAMKRYEADQLVRQRLLDDAATQYEAAKAAANQKEDPEQKASALDAAAKAYQDRVTALGVDLKEGYPTAGSMPDPKAGTTTIPTAASSRFSGTKFAGSQGLFSNPGELSLPNRVALLTAAGDNMTKAILTLFGDPSQLGQYRDKPVVYGVATVSVEPGWRTRKGYAAQIEVQPRYAFQDTPRLEYLAAFVRDEAVPCSVRAAVARRYEGTIAAGPVLSPAHGETPECLKAHADPDDDVACRYRKISVWDGFPFATVISPLIDAQTLDSQSSRRRSIDLSLLLGFQLQKAGLKGEAESFAQFAKSLQTDVATRDASVSVSTFNHGGGLFGFEIGPRLVGAEATKNEGAAQILGRQAFPALLMLSFDRRDLMPALSCARGGKAIACKPKMGDGGAPMGDGGAAMDRSITDKKPPIVRCSVAEPYVELYTTVHWKPLDSGFWWWQPRRLSHQERTAIAYDLRSAVDELDIEPSGIPTQHPMDRLVEVRSLVARRELNGYYARVALPTSMLVPPMSPVIGEIIPAQIALTKDAAGPHPRDFDFVITGERLDALDITKPAVLVGNATLDPNVAPRMLGSAIVVRAKVTAPDVPIVFSLAQPDGTVVTLPKVAVISDPVAKPKPKDQKPASPAASPKPGEGKTAAPKKKDAKPAPPASAAKDVSAKESPSKSAGR
jgi:hypothetical protein